MTKLLQPEDFIRLINKDADIIIPLSNGEPHRLLDILEEHHRQLENVTVHQLLALRERDYINGKMKGHLSHTSYFLSAATRKAFWEGHVELIPNVFQEMYYLLRKTTKNPMVIAVASPMDEHGYFSLGTNADYTADFIGEVPFVLEVNKHMPRAFGKHQIHISQIAGFVENDEPLTEEKSPVITDKDRKIAEYIAADIQDGDTLQIGIGAIPNAVMKMLKDRKHLGIHTEMLTDGIVDLVEAGAVDGMRKMTHKGKIVASFAFGSQKLYDFINNNPSVEFLPVRLVNSAYEIAKEDHMVSINATTEVDLYGQCASETVAGRYYSSSGGQADFARGVRLSKYGKGYVCMHSTVKNDTISRIKLHLGEGSIVTTSKNYVDNIVTEYGIARLHGKSISERAKALIGIAHPKFRDELTREAKEFGLFD
ncbi:acetyl-CoA hydrolase/transferase C-terminal domain-containing protein [Sporosarcina thermotolerans]|uniref:Acetyl-CoA hydrolase/transferase C-terminal domain-containing protein n=1 Tax=Sporosarcina thermotolerans TaxID=633404 RepID=A0AAW9ADU6_9BACL|nr:acetyl-CoA hydrolase/transferase C-terminal domain-containing protein [Sporosarcina thermotolerans]MDW0118255.1 acetyl-CoA hydrolase/transferase C-terminal domain-containing protein [Sporosarcina thermotolerans]WHT48565.1 acetyl-CoA hydrolase/transferase C-terminal domain-containing protein [Sporosarcina thermotolerans]